MIPIKIIQPSPTDTYQDTGKVDHPERATKHPIAQDEIPSTLSQHLPSERKIRQEPPPTKHKIRFSPPELSINGIIYKPSEFNRILKLAKTRKTRDNIFLDLIKGAAQNIHRGSMFGWGANLSLANSFCFYFELCSLLIKNTDRQETKDEAFKVLDAFKTAPMSVNNSNKLCLLYAKHHKGGLDYEMAIKSLRKLTYKNTVSYTLLEPSCFKLLGLLFEKNKITHELLDILTYCLGQELLIINTGEFQEFLETHLQAFTRDHIAYLETLTGTTNGYTGKGARETLLRLRLM